MAFSTRRALPPHRARRAASQLAPRAGRACSASRATLRKVRRAGSRSRSAEDCRRRTPCCSAMHEDSAYGTSKDPHVLRSCRNTYFGILIDILYAADCLLHHSWTRRSPASSSPIRSATGKDLGKHYTATLWNKLSRPRSTPLSTGYSVENATVTSAIALTRAPDGMTRGLPCQRPPWNRPQLSLAVCSGRDS